MALFKKDTTDVYVKDATFNYENDLEKTVKSASTHTHHNTLSWFTDSQITCNAPEILEKYTNVVKIVGLDFYLYFSKTAHSPFNFALYGYSMNVSAVYLNCSSSTYNRGRHFLLPSKTRLHLGVFQVQIGSVAKKTRKNGFHKGEGYKKLQALYVKRIKGQRTET
ncbi:hypothetical protein TKWG_21900 [Advenella kashmirensis WT001]|uniref:Uncharacterized protein n=1 Tax=Advenella kashmirensis (strain DSM 17095 / LMG 22695 / WT001) TaxID=1036672 RepID=I3UGB5_ADVKW|nr:hypothetical protein [Advenella kashmirensis]AFK64053.1 hypothetical protein TKWG_21900 [Advenella kashmirensis WT001]